MVIDPPVQKDGIFMKYYDTYLPYIIDDDYDWSYSSPEAQLLWRLDDLHDVLYELKQEDAPRGTCYRLSDDDIRYAIPGAFMNPGNDYLRSLSVVERAIELAKDDLVNKYGLPDPDTLVSDESEFVSETCVGQLSIFEEHFDKQPKAA